MDTRIALAQKIRYTTSPLSPTAQRSRATFICHADTMASWFTIEIGNTHYAAPNPGRSRPLVHFEWSPVVISEITMAARLIHGPATYDTYASKG